MSIQYKDIVPLFSGGPVDPAMFPAAFLQQVTYTHLKTAASVLTLAAEAAGNLTDDQLQQAFETLLADGTVMLEKEAFHIRPAQQEEIVVPIRLPVRSWDLLNLNIDRSGTHFTLDRPASSYDPITGRTLSSGSDGGGSSNNNNNNNNNNNG